MIYCIQDIFQLEYDSMEVSGRLAGIDADGIGDFVPITSGT